ncbi:10868_t:CDS:1 [Funneliformis mosseae]|uniref:10868_t:CDS:1 n=1 Tax=Funneliformis mosseae TaxID=27381 RepID=A0A9N9ATE3_FUNMO|nr:10868_t:CDS:1 [Funneliformis mosseae]
MYSSLNIFSTEILLIIFVETDISTLLSLSNTCKNFRRIAAVCLADKFKEQNVGLNLTFEQEHKWRSNLTMKFDHVNEENGNFVFKPKEVDTRLIYYHSAIIKNPNICRISLNNVKIDSTNELQHKINEPTDDTNLLQKSVGFPIKIRNRICQKIQHVYRTGNGCSHLKVPFGFTYSVVVPPNGTKSRAGERWITPLSFECPPSFFYPNEATVHRIFMSIINYRPIITKKQLTEKIVIPNASQKQHVSFQQQDSPIQQPILRQVSQIENQERKKFMISTKWTRGPRR